MQIKRTYKQPPLVISLVYSMFCFIGLFAWSWFPLSVQYLVVFGWFFLVLLGCYGILLRPNPEAAPEQFIVQGCSANGALFGSAIGMYIVAGIIVAAATKMPPLYTAVLLTLSALCGVASGLVIKRLDLRQRRENDDAKETKN